MIVVKIMGGLGNQMFQYAFYKKLTTLYDDVFIDDIELRKNGNQHNGLEVENVFGIKYNRISEAKLKLFLNQPHTHTIVWSFIDICLKILKLKKMDVYIQTSYDSEIFKYTDRYYVGYWGEQRYWNDISNLLVK